MTPLVLGLAPSPSQADGGTFWGSPSGIRLAAILRRALPFDGGAEVPWFDPRGPVEFANAWGGALRDPRALTLRRFRATDAERRAWDRCAGRHVLALGEQVCLLMWGYVPPRGSIFVGQGPYGQGAIVCHFPNPSPRSRFWDSPDNFTRAVSWARAFYDDWRAAQLAAQGKGA